MNPKGKNIAFVKHSTINKVIVGKYIAFVELYFLIGYKARHDKYANTLILETIFEVGIEVRAGKLHTASKLKNEKSGFIPWFPYSF